MRSGQEFGRSSMMTFQMLSWSVSGIEAVVLSVQPLLLSLSCI